MVSLKDVAQRAGVSVSTASYALNGRPETKEATREKVYRAAEELGYVVNGQAKSLQRGNSRICSLIISDISGPFFSEIIRGVESICYQNDYDLTVTPTYEMGKFNQFRVLKENRADGYLVFSQNINNSLLNRVGKNSPVIFFDKRADDSQFSSVTIDNYDGAKQAIEYLIKKGHQRILFLSGSEASFNNIDRVKGYQDVLRTHQCDYSEILYANFSDELAYEMMKNRLKQNFDFTAVFCSNDQMALGAYKAAEEMKLRIPQDLSIIGFDDSNFARFLSPSLTTIKQPAFLQGQLAAQKMFQILNSGEGNSNHPPLRTTLVERHSVQERVG